MPTFADFDLIDPLQRAIEARNYTQPTPIQAQAIPLLLQGRDVLGCAQTGTGKTAAFTLPVLQHIETRPCHQRGRRPIRALVLTPTRELAAQIGDNVAAYARYLHIRHTVIFGGVKQNAQVQTLSRGVDILIATPGRLLDLVGQGYIDLGRVEFFVLDEADRMLDMGFIHDVRRVLNLLPQARQNLLFSATMPESIVELAGRFLRSPARIDVTPTVATVEKVQQSVMFCGRTDKRRMLASLIDTHDVESAIVFTRTKHGANRLVKQLARDGIEAVAIHGNKSQSARTRALNGFRSGEISILVATDIASRGIDVEGVSHVFNYDLPNEPESYVHRIGRTARAGRGGVAIAFCDETEGEYLREIEKLIGADIPVVEAHPWHLPSAVPPPLKLPRRAQRRSAPEPPRAKPTDAEGTRAPRRRQRRRRDDGDQAIPPPVEPSAETHSEAGSSVAEGSTSQRRRRRRNRHRRGPNSPTSAAATPASTKSSSSGDAPTTPQRSPRHAA